MPWIDAHDGGGSVRAQRLQTMICERSAITCSALFRRTVASLGAKHKGYVWGIVLSGGGPLSETKVPEFDNLCLCNASFARGREGS